MLILSVKLTVFGKPYKEQTDTQNVAVFAGPRNTCVLLRNVPSVSNGIRNRAQPFKETKVYFFKKKICLLLFLLHVYKKAMKVMNVVSKIINGGKRAPVKIIQLRCTFHSSISSFIFIIRQPLLGGLCEPSQQTRHRTHSRVISFCLSINSSRLIPQTKMV